MLDEREFDRRVRACTASLFRICYTILPEPADRADAIQEALLRAWQRRGALRDESRFEAWLARIAINECRSMLRRGKRTRAVELTDAVPDPSTIPDPSLNQALMSLPLKLRLPLALRYAEGYSVEETARLLRVPVGTLKSRLTQARRKLKSTLEKGGFEP